MNSVFKQVFITGVIFLLTYNFSSAQEFQFSLLSGTSQYKEELLQPITYKGYRLGLGVDFEYLLQNDNLIFSEFSLAGVPTAKTYLGNDMSEINLNIETGYLFNVYSNWKSGTSLQAQYDYALYSLNYEYPFWFTQYSLNWKNRFDFYPSKKYQISVLLSSSLVGFLSRTEKEVLYTYKEDYQKAYFHQKMRFETLSDFQSLRVSFLFTKVRKDKNDLGLGYKLNYFQYAYPKPVTVFNHNLCLFLKFNRKNED